MYQPPQGDFTAGAIGFTYTWDPQVTALGDIPSLFGLTVTMIATNLDAMPTYRIVEPMIVSTDGKTATYTTTGNDFSLPGTYEIAFQVSKPDGTVLLETNPVTREIVAPL